MVSSAGKAGESQCRIEWTMPKSFEDWDKPLGKVHSPIGTFDLPTSKQVVIAVAVGVVALALIKVVSALIVTALLVGALYVVAHDVVILMKAEYQYRKDQESWLSFLNDGSSKASQALDRTYIAKYIALLL